MDRATGNVLDWVLSMDAGMDELEGILDRLEKCPGSEKARSAERAGLLGELVSVLERLGRFAEGGRETAQGEKEMPLVEARIAVLESVRKLIAVTFKEEAGFDWRWN